MFLFQVGFVLVLMLLFLLLYILYRNDEYVYC